MEVVAHAALAFQDRTTASMATPCARRRSPPTAAAPASTHTHSTCIMAGRVRISHHLLQPANASRASRPRQTPTRPRYSERHYLLTLRYCLLPELHLRSSRPANPYHGNRTVNPLRSTPSILRPADVTVSLRPKTFVTLVVSWFQVERRTLEGHKERLERQPQPPKCVAPQRK